MSDQDPPPAGDEPTREAGKTTLDEGDSPAAYGTFERLGDFEILRELGRGGMGVVYDARQISLKRRVALKVLRPGLGLTEQPVQRFECEAQAAAKLRHTNIVPVYATGAEQGCHYYAMELVEGPSIAAMGPDPRNPFLIDYHGDASRLLGVQ